MKNVLKKYSDVVKWFVDNPIPKDSRNDFQKYKYAGSEIVMHSVNNKLHELGLILQFCGFEVNCEKTQSVGNTIEKIVQKGETQTKSFDTLIIYTMRYDLIDIESGETLHFFVDVPFDNSQESKIKGFGSTSTYTQRYVFGEIFHLGFDEANPDATHNNKPAAKDYPKPQSNATKQPAPADNFPPFDEYSQIPQHPQNPKQGKPNTEGVISEPMRKRLYAISMEHKIDQSDIKDLIKCKYGKESSKDFTKDEYTEFCDLIIDNKFQDEYMKYVK